MRLWLKVQNENDVPKRSVRYHHCEAAYCCDCSPGYMYLGTLGLKRLMMEYDLSSVAKIFLHDLRRFVPTTTLCCCSRSSVNVCVIGSLRTRTVLLMMQLFICFTIFRSLDCCDRVANIFASQYTQKALSCQSYALAYFMKP